MDDIEIVSSSELSSARSITPTADTEDATSANTPIIYFGVETEPFFFLSTHFPSQISFSSVEFSSAEAVFQASKFAKYPELRSDIMKTVCVKDTIEKAQRWTHYIPVEWEELRIPVMKNVQMLKFLQNIQLQARLLQSGDAHLIYQSDTDSFFGSGHDGRGSNHLGKILMEIRSILKAYLVIGPAYLFSSFDLSTLSPPTRSIVWGPNLASEPWYPRKAGALKDIAIEPAIADAPAYESAFLHSIVHGDKPWTLEVLVQLREEVKEGAVGPLVRIRHNQNESPFAWDGDANVRLTPEHLKSSLMIEGGIYIYGFPLAVNQHNLGRYGRAVSIDVSGPKSAKRSSSGHKLIFTFWEN